MPHQQSVSNVWRRYPQRYYLQGNKCQTCGTPYFPPRVVCPKCRRKGKLEPYQFDGTGKIETYTKVHVAPDGMEAPYYLAVVTLENGARLTAQIVGTETVEIGMPVKLMFRKIAEDGDSGLIHYGYKFTPIS